MTLWQCAAKVISAFLIFTVGMTFYTASSNREWMRQAVTATITNKKKQVRQQYAYPANAGGGQLQHVQNPPRPPFKGNISVVDCMHRSISPTVTVTVTVKTDGGVQCRWCIKIAILDEYLVHHR